MPKHAGLTYFVVKHGRSRASRSVRSSRSPVESGFNEVFFNDVRIPDSDRISAVGNGWAVAITTLMNERVAVGGGGPGRTGVSDLLELARQTQIDGRPALERSDVRHRIADYYVKTKGLQYTSYRTLTALSRVHAGIGAPGAGHARRSTRDRKHRRLDLTLDAALAGLDLPAAEAAAVILADQAEPAHDGSQASASRISTVSTAESAAPRRRSSCASTSASPVPSQRIRPTTT